MKFCWVVAAVAALAACSDDDNGPKTPPFKDKYQGGFYVLNEGNGLASINYYTSEGWQLNIYQTNNDSEELGKTGSVGVCSAENMYIVTKMEPFLVEIGMEDFVKKSQLSSDLGQNAQARSFTLFDDSRAVLTATTGAYIVNLDPLSLGTRFCEESIGIAEGDVCIENGHIFLIAGAKVKAYNASSLAFEKDVCDAVTGFAKAGGALWAANGSKLLKINTSNLSSEEIDLGADLEVYNNSFSYSPTCLHASKSGDALYFTQRTEKGWSIDGRDIYKYTISTDTAAKFFTAPDGYVTYGAGVNVDPKSGDLYLIYKREGWGDNSLFNDIYIVDAATGAQKQKIVYTTEDETVFWFPSMVIFR